MRKARRRLAKRRRSDVGRGERVQLELDRQAAKRHRAARQLLAILGITPEEFRAYVIAEAG